MNNDVVGVVGVAFIKEGKMLVVQSHRSKRAGNYFTFVGGGIEEGETPVEAACREVAEEIGFDFTIETDELEHVLTFRESATSDPNLQIEMSVFVAHKEIDVPLIPNDEILEYRWYQLNDRKTKVSSSIKDHFVPYAIENVLLY